MQDRAPAQEEDAGQREGDFTNGPFTIITILPLLLIILLLLLSPLLYDLLQWLVYLFSGR